MSSVSVKTVQQPWASMTSSTDSRVKAARVAVLDDDPRIRTLLEDELLDLGLTPHLCGTALDLLQLLQEHSIDLVLMDVAMPEVGGLECLIQLKQVNYQGPVVMVTAIDDDTIRQSCLQNGAREYVLKNELFDRLTDLLNTHLQLTLTSS